MFKFGKVNYVEKSALTLFRKFDVGVQIKFAAPTGKSELPISPEKFGNFTGSLHLTTVD